MSLNHCTKSSAFSSRNILRIIFTAYLCSSCQFMRFGPGVVAGSRTMSFPCCRKLSTNPFLTALGDAFAQLLKLGKWTVYGTCTCASVSLSLVLVRTAITSYRWLQFRFPKLQRTYIDVDEWETFMIVDRYGYLLYVMVIHVSSTRFSCIFIDDFVTFSSGVPIKKYIFNSTIKSN